MKRILTFLMCFAMLVSMCVIGASVVSAEDNTQVQSESAQNLPYDRATLEALIDSEAFPAADYPWAVFFSESGGQDWKYAKDKDTYAFETYDAAINALVNCGFAADAEVNGKTYSRRIVLMLRANYTMEEKLTNLAFNMGQRWGDQFYFDLGEHTIDMSAMTASFLPYQMKRGNDFTTKPFKLSVIGGNFINVKAGQGLFAATSGNAGADTASISVELYGTKITVADGATNPIFYRSSAAGKQIPELSVTMKNCVIDISGAAKNYKPFVNADTGATLNIDIDGTNTIKIFENAEDNNKLINGGLQADDTLNCSAEFVSVKSVINAINVTIKSDLALNYYTNIPEAEKDSYTLKIGDKTLKPEIKAHPETDEQTVTFIFDGIGPHEVSKELTAQLCKGDEVFDEKTTSVMQYCHELYASNTDKPALVTLICDLLVYAREAETYKTGSSTITMPEGLVEADACTKAELTDADNIMAVKGNGNENLYIAAAGVHFNTVNKIFFKIYSADGNFTAKIGEKTYQVSDMIKDGNYYTVYTDGIAPAAYGDAVVIELSNDAKLQYSVNTYAYNMKSDTKIGNLADKLYKFGVSCKNYAEA